MKYKILLLSGNALRSIQSIEENHDDQTSGSFIILN